MKKLLCLFALLSLGLASHKLVVVDFECATPGQYETLSFAKGDVAVNLSGVGGKFSVAPSGVQGFGQASLVTEGDNCLSDEEPIIRVRFEPPVAAVRVSMAALPGHEDEPPFWCCWRKYDDVGQYDPEQAYCDGPGWSGFSLVPGAVYASGFTTYSGFVACDLVYGVFDSLAFEPGDYGR